MSRMDQNICQARSFEDLNQNVHLNTNVTKNAYDLVRNQNLDKNSLNMNQNTSQRNTKRANFDIRRNKSMRVTSDKPQAPVRKTSSFRFAMGKIRGQSTESDSKIEAVKNNEIPYLNKKPTSTLSTNEGTDSRYKLERSPSKLKIVWSRIFNSKTDNNRNSIKETVGCYQLSNKSSSMKLSRSFEYLVFNTKELNDPSGKLRKPEGIQNKPKQAMTTVQIPRTRMPNLQKSSRISRSSILLSDTFDLDSSLDKSVNSVSYDEVLSSENNYNGRVLSNNKLKQEKYPCTSYFSSSMSTINSAVSYENVLHPINLPENFNHSLSSVIREQKNRMNISNAQNEVTSSSLKFKVLVSEESSKLKENLQCKSLEQINKKEDVQRNIFRGKSMETKHTRRHESPNLQNGTSKLLSNTTMVIKTRNGKVKDRYDFVLLMISSLEAYKKSKTVDSPLVIMFRDISYIERNKKKLYVTEYINGEDHFYTLEHPNEHEAKTWEIKMKKLLLDYNDPLATPLKTEAPTLPVHDRRKYGPNESPVFGRRLSDVCPKNRDRVPSFVKKCIVIIENNQKNTSIDGLYCSRIITEQVLSIKRKADKHSLERMDKNTDVRDLASALKLFFIELEEPLIPFEFYEEISLASFADPNLRINAYKNIVRMFPQCNRDTLQYLLEHLIRLANNHGRNRMCLANLAIAVSPSLMWIPERANPNTAVNIFQKNLVIEHLMNDFSEIFELGKMV